MSIDWQQVISRHRQEWLAMDQWKDPDVHDCVLFLGSEGAELAAACCEASLELNGYNRNHPGGPVDLPAIFEEAAGVLLMAHILADLTGTSFDMMIAEYLEGMTARRMARMWEQRTVAEEATE